MQGESAAVRFLHTGDWQLGMRRWYFGTEEQAHYTRARLRAVERMGRLAREEGCAFAVVAGDVFESNQVDRRTVLQALESMRLAEIDLYLLPGNHDPLDAASVYRSRAFEEARPSNVHVLDSAEPREVAPGVELVAAPWPSKRPLSDPAAPAYAELAHPPAGLRVAVAHGEVDLLAPDPDKRSAIRLAVAEQALREGRIHYLALGDKHSRTPVGESGRIWYSGTPEPTSFRETEPGQALIVELTGEECRVEPHTVGTWTFHDAAFELSSGMEVDALGSWLEGLDGKAETAVRMRLSGQLSLRDYARLEELLEHHRELFAALFEWQRHSDLVAVPDDLDESSLELSGFAQTAVSRLREQASVESEEAVAARDALALLYRLAATERGAGGGG